MVAPPHRPIECDVTLHEGRAQRNGGHGGRQARFVPAVPDGNSVALGEGPDHPEVEFLEGTRVGARGMGDEELISSEAFHCGIDLVEGRHPRREDHCSTRRCETVEHADIGYRCARNLVGHRVERLEELDRVFVPG